jgi:hypothetical protein
VVLNEFRRSGAAEVSMSNPIRPFHFWGWMMDIQMSPEGIRSSPVQLHASSLKLKLY